MNAGNPPGSLLRYVTGDATRPEGDGPKIIAHVCNDAGGWGAGFVLAVSARWGAPEQAYRSAAKHDLGDVQLVSVGPDLWVANMVAQHGTGGRPAGGLVIPPVRYWAVQSCLDTVGAQAEFRGASVHMPRIGCGLAGGRWECIEPLIVAELREARDIPVTVYDLPEGPWGSGRTASTSGGCGGGSRGG